MTEQAPDDLKEREFQLKLVQAWGETKYKVATGLIVLNIGILATAAAFMKDKGPDEPSLNALDAGLTGLGFASIAYVIVWLVSDQALSSLISRQESIILSNKKPIKVVDWVVLIFLTLSGFGLIRSVAYVSGWSQAQLECARDKAACLSKARK